MASSSKAQAIPDVPTRHEIPPICTTTTSDIDEAYEPLTPIHSPHPRATNVDTTVPWNPKSLGGELDFLGDFYQPAKTGTEVNALLMLEADNERLFKCPRYRSCP